MKRLCLDFLIIFFGATPLMADVPPVHGMLLFGKTATYASHLPMFHPPHDYQSIFKLALEDTPNQNTVKKYTDTKADGVPLFTLLPEAIDLTKLIDGTQKTFKAKIFNGHFERGGEDMGDVIVHVTEIIQAKKLLADKSPSSDFIAFGESGEYFAAHLIKGQPTYDAVMAIEPPYYLNLANCGRAGCPAPTKIPVPDQNLPVAIHGANEHTQTSPGEGELIGLAPGALTQVKKMIYVEVDELNQSELNQ